VACLSTYPAGVSASLPCFRLLGLVGTVKCDGQVESRPPLQTNKELPDNAINRFGQV